MKKPCIGLYLTDHDSSSVYSIGCGMRSLRWHRAQSFSLTAFPYCWYVAYTPERSSSFVCNLQRRLAKHTICFPISAMVIVSTILLRQIVKFVEACDPQGITVWIFLLTLLFLPIAVLLCNYLIAESSLY